MEKWKEMTVGDLCQTISDTYHRNDTEVVLINTSDVLKGKILNHQSVLNKNLKGQFKKTFKKDDILYSEIRPANRRYAYIDFEDTENYIASTKLMVLRPNKNIVLPRFLLAYLSSSNVIAELQHLAETRSGTFPQITFSSELARLPITVPNLKIQKKIVGILDSIEEKIRNNDNINKNLIQQAQALYSAWFELFLPFGGSMPSDWHIGTLGDIATIKTTSFNPLKNPGVRLEHYSIPAYDEQHFPVFESSDNVKSNKYILTENFVLASKLNPDTKRIWRPMCLTDHAVCSTEFIVFEANNNAHKDFLFSIIDSQSFSDWMCAHTTGSTNSRQRTTPSTTLEFKVHVAPDEVIDEFCASVTPMYDLISQNLLENQGLASLRDSLLPKLMSGEIGVSDIDL